MTLEPVAIAHSQFTDLFGTPRQGALTPSSRAFVELLPAYKDRGFLDGLEGFSHVWLIWSFHRNKNKVVNAKARPPRLDGKKIGVFASRAPHRPNPLGLSCCEIVQIQHHGIEVKGHDLVDQTPILDIKPYIPEYDAFPEAKNGWLKDHPLKSLEVRFADGFFQTARKLNIKTETLLPLIRECLQNDPRPLVYRQMPDRIHTLALHPWDIDFRGTEDGFVVERIREYRQ